MYFWVKKLNLDSNLTTIEAQWLQKSTATLCQILHNSSLYINLKLKQIHILPVGAIKSKDVPCLAHLKQELWIKSSFYDISTWAHLQRETTSRKEKILRSSSLGSILLIGASSGRSANIWESFHPTLLLLEMERLEPEACPLRWPPPTAWPLERPLLLLIQDS